MPNGHIKLHRAFLEWGWYKNTETKAVFLHLLLMANWKPSEFMGEKIERGQVVFSYRGVAEATGLGVQVVRTAISHLVETQEITLHPTQRYSIATIVKYGVYQDCSGETNTPTNTPDGIPLTHDQHTANIIQEDKKERKEEKNNCAPAPETMGTVMDGWGASAKLKATMGEFIEMRKHTNTPLNVRSLKMAIKRLGEISGGEEQTAIQIIENSIAGGYRGLFPLKNAGTPQAKKEVNYDRITIQPFDYDT